MWFLLSVFGVFLGCFWGLLVVFLSLSGNIIILVVYLVNRVFYRGFGSLSFAKGGF